MPNNTLNLTSELLELAEHAEGSGVFESLWVGDNCSPSRGLNR